ncbi:MAG: glycosyltransferase family 39 protein [Phycisphaerales bacterium]|nr:glycosyltransferase family 39 protein [Phycisphaerales bacterium]
MNHSTDSAAYRRDPALTLGIVVALVILGIELVPMDALSGFFGHPSLVDRLGAIPANTTRGATLLAMALPFAAIAWIATPLLNRRLRGNDIDPPQPTGRRDGWILLGLLLAGGFLRVLRMEESLWYDEIAALTSFSIYGPGPALGNYYALSNHVLHSALVSMSAEVAGGVTEPIVRTPALLFGILAIPAGFLLGREVGSSRTGLLTAFAIALMPVAVLESVEARGYSMMLCFSLLASWLFLRIGRDPRGINLLGYAAVATLGTWSHLVFACVLIGHGMLAAIGLFMSQGRQTALRQLLALGLAGVSIFTVLSPILPDLLDMRARFGAADGDEPTLLGPEGLHAFLQLGGAWAWWAATPALIMVIVGLCAARTPRLRMGLLATGLAGAVAVALAIVGDSWLYARFLVFMLAFAALAFAGGVEWLARMERTGRLAAGVAIVVAIPWLVDLAVRTPKQPIREGVNTLAELAGETPCNALSLGLADDVASYYAQPRNITLVPTGSLGNALPDLASAPDLAIMLYPDRHPDSIHEQLQAAGYREAARHEGWLDWGHGDVVVFRRSGG